MLPDHSPYNSHFLFSCATWAGHHYDLSLSDIFIQRSGFSLNPLLEYWHRPQQDAVGMWCWLIIPQSVRGSKDPSTVLKHVAPGSVWAREEKSSDSTEVRSLCPLAWSLQSYSPAPTALCLWPGPHTAGAGPLAPSSGQNKNCSQLKTQHNPGPGHTSFSHHSEPT